MPHDSDLATEKKHAGTHGALDASSKLLLDSDERAILKHNPTRSANDTTGGSAQKALPALEIGPAKEWTMIVKLGASLPGNTDQPIGFGVEHKLDELKKLSADTSGKSVNFIVDAERPIDKKGQLCHSPGTTAEQSRTCDEQAIKSARVTTERYFVHDGIIEKLPNPKEKNEKDEITALLKDASKLSPSSKLGLVIQSHGMGSDGIATNRGLLSLDKTVGAIADGLKASGRSKLDILDLDACSMGNIAVLDKLAKLSDNVVASASAEGSTGGADGQNLKSALKQLLDNPAESGKELAASIVEQARHGDNGAGRFDATMTLASFDMTHLPEFKQSLDDFGKQLAAASSDKKNMGAIRSVIDQTVPPENAQEEFQQHERDLKSFAKNILAAIESGKIKTAAPDLANSANAFLKNLDEFAPHQFGEAARGYDKLGALTANIPGKELLDRQELGHLLSPIHRMEGTIQGIQNEGLGFANKKDITDKLDQAFKDLVPLQQAPGNPYLQLKNARTGIDSAKTNTELQSGLQDMLKLAESLDQSKVGKETTIFSMYYVDESRQYYRSHRPSTVTPGWDAFIKKLESSAT